MCKDSNLKLNIKIMKKILALAFLFLAAKLVSAQDAADSKSFRFGLKMTPSIDWYNPDDKKKFENGGAVLKFGYGLVTEFRLSNIVSFATGLQVDYSGGKLNFKDTANYYFSNDAIITYKDTTGASYDKFRLKERKYDVTYITIPLTLKMKTTEIGYFTYFGQFGVNCSFKLKARADDKAESTTTSQSADQSQLDITDDMNFFKFALNVGGGAEYNLSGSTSILFGVNYFNGFSNVLKKESKYLFNSKSIALKQIANSNGIVLNVGILF